MKLKELITAPRKSLRSEYYKIHVIGLLFRRKWKKCTESVEITKWIIEKVERLLVMTEYRSKKE